MELHPLLFCVAALVAQPPGARVSASLCPLPAISVATVVWPAPVRRDAVLLLNPTNTGVTLALSTPTILPRAGDDGATLLLTGPSTSLAVPIGPRGDLLILAVPNR